MTGLLTLLAAAGLGISAIAHLASFLSYPIVNKPVVLTLHLGMLGLAVLVAVDHSKQVAMRKISYDVFRRYAYPRHVSYVVLSLFAWAVSMFFFAFFLKFTGYEPKSEIEDKALAIRIFSAGWVFLYYLLYEVSKASLRVAKLPRVECAYGHGVLGDVKRCTICGSIKFRLIKNED